MVKVIQAPLPHAPVRSFLEPDGDDRSLACSSVETKPVQPRSETRSFYSQRAPIFDFNAQDPTAQVIYQHNEKTFQHLKTAVSLNLRRQFFIALCDNLNLRNQFAMQLQAELSDSRSSGKGKQFVSLMLDLGDPNPVGQVATWLQHHPHALREGNLLGFQILGIENLTRQVPAVQRLFLSYLRTIERNLPRLNCTVLLWVTRPWGNTIQQAAPECWNWSTGIFEFAGDPVPLLSTLFDPMIFSPGESRASSDPDELAQMPGDTSLPSTPVSYNGGRSNTGHSNPVRSNPGQSNPRSSSDSEPVSGRGSARESVPPSVPPSRSHSSRHFSSQTEDPLQSDRSATYAELKKILQEDLAVLDQSQGSEWDSFASFDWTEKQGTARAETIEESRNDQTQFPLTAQKQASGSPVPIVGVAQQYWDSGLPTDSERDLKLDLERDLPADLKTAQSDRYLVGLDPVGLDPVGLDPEVLDPRAVDSGAVDPGELDPSDFAEENPLPAILNPIPARSMNLAELEAEIETLRSQNASLSNLAQAHLNLGRYYRQRIEQGEMTTANLERAIAAYEQVLEWLCFSEMSSQELGDIGWADSLNDLGTLYWIASRNMPTTDTQEYLQQAVQAYQLGLKKIDEAEQPRSYAMLQNNLGTVFSDLAQWTAPLQHLTWAVEAYQAALKYRRPETDPLKFAATQNNLGTAYWHLAQHLDMAENLKQAISAYNQALRYYRPDQEPGSYAMIQNNLGTAYWNLSQCVSEKTGQTLATAPSSPHSSTHSSPSATALESAGFHTSGTPGQDSRSQETHRQETHRQETHQASSRDWLLLAVNAYQSALRFRTIDSATAAYASTQNNLGTAYWHLANLAQDQLSTVKSYLKLSIEAYTAALQAANKLDQQGQILSLNFDRFATHNNLGLILYQRAILKEESSEGSAETLPSENQLASALHHHLQALRGWQAYPDLYQTALNAIVQTIRTCYEYWGTAGQNRALNQVPGALLAQVLGKL